MEIRELRTRLGETQSEFAARYRIPFRTVQNWEAGVRKPPEYLLRMLEKEIQADLVNRRTRTLPAYDPGKKDLPKRSEFVGATAWLKAVREAVGGEAVFALDEALMCDGSFGGRSDEFLVWLYGDRSLARFNGVVVLGDYVSEYSVKEKNGLRYTDLNRTLSDSFANEEILDMQGITEALSRYYYRKGGSFEGLAISPEYQKRFEALAEEAIGYYGE